MPKMKTNRAAAKRFRTTGTGKIVRNQANKRHILTKKTSKRKRQLVGTTIMRKCDVQIIDALLPYRRR
ncbi:MAG: large subunit ribosomal protein L35 [Flavobacteriales bacterium]|jgi:large subunit ribosomal protein L35